MKVDEMQRWDMYNPKDSIHGPLVLKQDGKYVLYSEAKAIEEEKNEQIAALRTWLQWCLDNCDDSPEYNFGTDATEEMKGLLAQAAIGTEGGE